MKKLSRKYYFLSILLGFLFATVSVGADQKQFKVEFKRIEKLPSGYNILIEETSDNVWTIKEISESTLKRNNQNQEILYLNINELQVQPLYEMYKYIESHGDFECIKYKTDVYNPCISKLTRTSASANSVLSSIVSAGFGIGKVRTLDESKIIAIVQQTELITRVEEYAKLKSEWNEVFNNYVKTALSLKAKYDSEYKEYVASHITLDMTVQDKTGMYKNDIDLSSLYKIELNILPAPDIKISFDPSDTAFRAKLSSMLDSYEEKLKEQSSNCSLKAHKHQKINNYSIEVIAPSTIAFNRDLSQQREVITINVIAKDIRDAYPSYSNEDKVLRVAFDGRNITLQNKTNQFLQVKTISVYYNNEIATTNLGDSLIELPPLAFTKEPISINRLANSNITKESTYNEMTAKKAQHADISFGFAVKYRLEEQNIDKTLFKLNNYKLYDLLKIPEILSYRFD